MKTSTVLYVAAALAVSSVHAQDGAFTNEEKALWIDRHNYFRMTGLPWSAANMLKIKWSDDLATAAISEAKGCAAATGTGINVHTHADTATTSVVDSAFQEWAVATALKVFPTLTAPKDGEAVGTGVYNSYSQIVWSSTNQVGCGYATCSSSKSVVCKYAPAGNSANEPWYIHNVPSSQCPAGTEDKDGLCIVPGDAGNNAIAAIPAGANAYDVFASFVGSMQKALKGETVDAGPMSGTNSSTNPGAGSAATPAPATTDAAATPSVTPATGGSTTATGSSTTDSPTTEETSVAGGSTTDAETGSTKSVGFGSLTDGSDGAPGVVRPSSNTGSTFSNEATRSGTAPVTSAATSADAAVEAASSETSKTESGSATANAKSSDADSSGHSISAAGVAGAIVVGCVMIAGIAVFVSYRKNQRRQRDIMQNGGIHIL